MKPKSASLFILFIIVVLGQGCMLLSSQNKDDKDSSQFKGNTSKKGLCWVAGDSIANHNITQITAIGANWISQTPFGSMKSYSDPYVKGRFKDAWWGENDSGIAMTAKMAKAHGIKTMLKPHIWISGNREKWRSDIEMNSEEEWDQWFESYGEWILHYAQVANDAQLEALCIGTELHMTTKHHPEKWRALIRKIRTIYKGELTYAANWYKEYEDITFWDDLDYIGIQAYFPLSSKDYPNEKELLSSWGKHKKDLKRISNKFGKKIVFTEIGYKNTSDAAKEPWTWPQDMDETIKISQETQNLCYTALFESLWNEPWFDGLFIWKWFHTTYEYETYEAQRKVMDARREAWYKSKNKKIRTSIKFTPQGGPALEILKHWYSKDTVTTHINQLH